MGSGPRWIGRPPGGRSYGPHWGAIAGADFFTSEVWSPRGLVTYYTLFVVDLRSRRVHVTGSTPTPKWNQRLQCAAV